MSVIQKYLLNLYISKLNIFFFKAENDHYFSSLITNELNNQKDKKDNTNLNDSKKEECKDENNNKQISLIGRIKQLSYFKLSFKI